MWAGLNRLYAPIVTLVFGLIAAGLVFRFRLASQTFGPPRLQMKEQLELVSSLGVSYQHRSDSSAHFGSLADISLSFYGTCLMGDHYLCVTGNLAERCAAGMNLVIAEACEGLDSQVVISTGHGVSL